MQMILTVFDLVRTVFTFMPGLFFIKLTDFVFLHRFLPHPKVILKDKKTHMIVALLIVKISFQYHAQVAIMGGIQ